MNDLQRNQLNHFFVRTFNNIMAWEDKALSERGFENISVKETHVIESVVQLAREGQNNMTAIANQLKITIGALSTSVQTLINKGYLQRSADPGDRRVVLVTATASGRQVNEIHESFHQQMIDFVADQFSKADLQRLTNSLEQLSLFFESLSNKK